MKLELIEQTDLDGTVWYKVLIDGAVSRFFYKKNHAEDYMETVKKNKTVKEKILKSETI